jgi:thiamine biosynthesis lipoprotein
MKGIRNRLAMTYILLLFFTYGCADNSITKETQVLMGTMVDISAAAPGMNRDVKAAAIKKAFDRLRQIDEIMSSYRQTSELSMVNNFADVRPIRVGADMIKVIKRADELNKITQGAFDITVAPLVELWGFGPKGAVLRMPKDEDIKQALRLTGMQKLKIDYAKKTVAFASSGMKIDLGGIAVGYAVDCAIEVLKESGIRNAMINAGGDIFCMGEGPGGHGWKIGIQHPRIRNELLETVPLKDRAIATSGDYERFFFWNEKRVSHIIDPRTGMTVTDTPASVSIISPDCMTADALSTAIFVLGPDEGIRVLNKMRSVEGMIVVDKGKDIEVYKTDGFGKK